MHKAQLSSWPLSRASEELESRDLVGEKRRQSWSVWASPQKGQNAALRQLPIGVVVTEFAAGKTFGDKSICLNFDFSSSEQSRARHEDIVQGGVCQ